MLKTLLQRFKFWLVGLCALLLFLGGWCAHLKFVKPVERVVTIQVPVKIDGGPAKEETQHPNGTVTPGVHYTATVDQPKPPDEDPNFKPDSTTVIEVPTYKPVRVFYQNELKFQDQPDDAIKVWIDAKVWATYEDGEVIKGLHVDSTFSSDKAVTFPLRVKTKETRVRPWAVGGKYNLNSKEFGAWLERDIAAVRLGVDVDFTKRDGTQVWVKGGWTF